MTSATRKTIFWTPRILTILFAAFLSLFALDVFQEGRGALETTLALAIHLVPVYLVLAALAVAWKWEWVGALLFSGLGVWYVVMAGGKEHWSAVVFISGPLFLVGALFLAGWMGRKRW